MESFIDSVINNNSTIVEGKNSFENDICSLTFIRDKTNMVILYEIYIREQYRKIGQCRNILLYIINKCKETDRKFIVISVLSKILYSYLLRFECENGKFKITREGFEFKFKKAYKMKK